MTNMKQTIWFIGAIAIASAWGGLAATDTRSSVPKALWGRYCPENSLDCTPREFYIEANSIWSESDGGCGQIEKVETSGDRLNIFCKDSPNMTLQKLPKKKLRITIRQAQGDESKIIQKLK